MGVISAYFGANDAYTAQVEWTQGAQSVENNTTVVRFACKVISNRSGASFNGYARTDVLTVNGVSVDLPHGNYRVPGGGSVTLWEYDMTVAHDGDGSFNAKAISCDVKIETTFSSSGYVGTVTPSGTMTLTTIPRASSMTISGATLGEQVSFTITAASSAFTHSLTYEYGGATGTILSYVKAGTHKWTPPIDLAAQFPNDKSGTVKYTLYTWNGTTAAIGSKAYTATLTVPASAAPTVADGWAAASYYNTGTAAAGIAAFVQGYSKAQVTFDASKITRQHGATIKGYKISCAGVADSADPYLTGVLNGTSAEIVCTVEDSRGYTATETIKVDVFPYSKPKLANISLYRSGADGIADAAGLHIYAKATLIYSEIGGLNSCPMYGYYRAQKGSYGDGIPIASNTGSFITDAALNTQTYVAKIEATDSLGNSVFYEATIPTDSVAFHLRKNGTGAGFGKYCEEDNLLDIAWRMKVRESLTADGTITGADLTAENGNVHIRNQYPTLALMNTEGRFACQIVCYSGLLALRVFHENGTNYTEYLLSPPETEATTQERMRSVKTKQINLANYTYTWTKSGSGLYYTFFTTLADIGLTGKTVIGVYCSGWNGHSADSLLQPYVQGAQVGLMATAPVTPLNYYLTISYV